jgi:hypothetical protein
VPPQKGSGAGRLFFLGLAIIGLAAFAAPTALLLLFGMVPSLVAYIVDRGGRPIRAFAIAPLNLAGLMPYLLDVWTSRQPMPVVVHHLTDVFVWFVVYMAAGAGWLVSLGMPSLVALALERSLDRRKAKLKAVQARLRADWGAEVDPAMAES